MGIALTIAGVAALTWIGVRFWRDTGVSDGAPLLALAAILLVVGLH